MKNFDVFLSSDQPVTCPQCGNRTDIFADLDEASQYHRCLSHECKYEFIVESDPITPHSS